MTDASFKHVACASCYTLGVASYYVATARNLR